MKIIRQLLEKGYSKYRIAKELKVSWNTVRRWELGTYKPHEEHGIRLLELLRETSK